MYCGRSAVLSVLLDWECKFFSAEGCSRVCVCETDGERRSVCKLYRLLFCSCSWRAREKKKENRRQTEKMNQGHPSFALCARGDS